MALSGEAAAQLQEGIKLVLSRWTALRMAVDNSSGGPHSSQIPLRLSQSLFDLLTNSTEKVYIDDVVPMLEHHLKDYLNTFFDDGGFEYTEVAVKLLTMHEECLEGNFNSIKRLKEANPPRRVPYYIQQKTRHCFTPCLSENMEYNQQCALQHLHFLLYDFTSSLQLRVVHLCRDDSDDDVNENTIEEILSNYDSSAMVVDAPTTGSRDIQGDVIDSPQTDDGWTVVGGPRRNRGRRN